MIILLVLVLVLPIFAYHLGFKDGLEFQKKRTTPCIFKTQAPAKKPSDSEFIV